MTEYFTYYVNNFVNFYKKIYSEKFVV